MKISRIAGIAALLTAGLTQAQTPTVKFDGALIELWYTQLLDNSLRYNKAALGYYDGLSSAQANVGNAQGSLGRFQENAFAVKRTEIYLSGKVSDEVSWNLMFDPNQSANGIGNNVLQDAVITWNFAKGFKVKAGQFKMPTTYESTLVSAREILFFDRTQLSRLLSERRDRGVWFSYGYGDANGFRGNLNLAISNGTSDDGSNGKNNDANAQKDYTFRFDGSYRSNHKFGIWYREGETGLKSSTAAPGTVAAWGASAPSAQQILDNRDKTTAEGIFYAFDQDEWHFDFEYATGLIGRRSPTLYDSTGTVGAVKREHLDQKFTGYAVTGVYKLGAHWLTARYDLMNYNSGNDWYTATSPYIVTVNGAPADYTPKYTEITLGYNYLFAPTKQSIGKLKLDYIIRSKNYLAPLAALGQTGEQGGNSLVASLMVGF